MIDEKIDDYINCFEIGEIEEGMSAKFYLAFETNNMEKKYMMVYVENGFDGKGKAFVYYNDNE